MLTNIGAFQLPLYGHAAAERRPRIARSVLAAPYIAPIRGRELRLHARPLARWPDYAGSSSQPIASIPHWFEQKSSNLHLHFVRMQEECTPRRTRLRRRFVSTRR